MARVNPWDFAPEPGIEPCTPKQFHERMARRRRNLRDPKFAHVRDYPKWRQGTRTADYVRLYEEMNKARVRPGPGFTVADRAAPWNEEADA